MTVLQGIKHVCPHDYMCKVLGYKMTRYWTALLHNVSLYICLYWEQNKILYSIVAFIHRGFNFAIFAVGLYSMKLNTK